MERFEKDKCDKCGTPIVLKRSESKTRWAYYSCPCCGTVWHDNKFIIQDTLF